MQREMNSEKKNGKLEKRIRNKVTICSWRNQKIDNKSENKNQDVKAMEASGYALCNVWEIGNWTASFKGKDTLKNS